MCAAPLLTCGFLPFGHISSCSFTAVYRPPKPPPRMHTRGWSVLLVGAVAPGDAPVHSSVRMPVRVKLFSAEQNWLSHSPAAAAALAMELLCLLAVARRSAVLLLLVVCCAETALPADRTFRLERHAMSPLASMGLWVLGAVDLQMVVWWGGCSLSPTRRSTQAWRIDFWVAHTITAYHKSTYKSIMTTAHTFKPCCWVEPAVSKWCVPRKGSFNILVHTRLYC